MEEYVFFTMGMFIIDEIHFPGRSQSRFDDVIGGAGTYAALGAGSLVSKEERKRIGFILDKGNDFPANMEQQIDNWGLGVKYRCSDRLTTRGKNVFGSNEQRSFEYLTPKLQIQAEDLLEYDTPATAKSLHFICSPLRLVQFVDSLDKQPGQLYVWEPVPTACIPEEWVNFEIAFQKVDVLTPNALEAAAFVGKPEPLTENEVESIVEQHYSSYPGFLVVRCGAMGAFARGVGWYKPYHTDASKVVDPSGAGNSFVGGLALGLVKYKGDKNMAMVYATVAAGITIEQLGVPVYNPKNDTWNGLKTEDRINRYLQTLPAVHPLQV